MTGDGNAADPSTTDAGRHPSRRRRRRIVLVSRAALVRLAVLLVICGLLVLWAWSSWISMPGESWSGPLPALTAEQEALAATLRADVEALAGDIGSRSVFEPEELERAAAWVESRLAAGGLEVIREPFTLPDDLEVRNLYVDVPGTSAPDEIVVVGAHYDTIAFTPGADDNASGVAGLIALLRRFEAEPADRTVRFVAFTTEEPPHFAQPTMGSRVHARRAAERGDDMRAMLSLEMIGYYSEEPDSQNFPWSFDLGYPTTADFVAFSSNTGSGDLVRRCVEVFRAEARFPCEGASLPVSVDGTDWSDHRSFWPEGVPAVMVTDTALFRNEHYHGPGDTPDTLDYERMARVVDGVEIVIRRLAEGWDR